MNTGTIIFCSALALLCGFLAQQSIQTLINTYLTFLPFEIRNI